MDNLPNNGFAANGAGDAESTPNPGSISGDGPSADLVDQSTDSTQDSNSAEFSRETSTVVPPARSRDEDGGLATLPPTSGQAATDKAGAFRIWMAMNEEHVLKTCLSLFQVLMS